MSDSSRERCKIREVRVNMNGVKISRDFQVRFVHYESEFYEESSLYGQMPAKILADVMPK